MVTNEPDFEIAEWLEYEHWMKEYGMKPSEVDKLSCRTVSAFNAISSGRRKTKQEVMNDG